MNQLSTDAKGVFVIAVTPFTDAGALDLASTDRMVDFYLERGATGLTILGILGEATKLTAEERAGGGWRLGSRFCADARVE
jgi:4-hydroxy-tetrahydrodipicolinate synthase